MSQDPHWTRLVLVRSLASINGFRPGCRRVYRNGIAGWSAVLTSGPLPFQGNPNVNFSEAPSIKSGSSSGPPGGTRDISQRYVLPGQPILRSTLELAGLCAFIRWPIER